LDQLKVYLELKKTIKDQLEEPEIKQLMEDINHKVFGATWIARIARLLNLRRGVIVKLQR
jgi:RNase P/RNase MRP subunit POP5